MQTVILYPPIDLVMSIYELQQVSTFNLGVTYWMGVTTQFVR